VKVPAEEVGWGLTPGSGGLSGLPTDEKQPEVGLETADRFIHHVPWEYPFLRHVTLMFILYYNKRHTSNVCFDLLLPKLLVDERTHVSERRMTTNAIIIQLQVLKERASSVLMR
jgi:hypothetical protein